MDKVRNRFLFNNLKIAKGQVEGIIRMVEEGRYCIDISSQIMASVSILKKVNARILHDHMKGCVKSAIEKGEGDKSLDEVLEIIERCL